MRLSGLLVFLFQVSAVVAGEIKVEYGEDADPTCSDRPTGRSYVGDYNDDGPGIKLEFDLGTSLVTVVSDIHMGVLTIQRTGGNRNVPFDDDEVKFLEHLANGIEETSAEVPDPHSIHTLSVNAARLLASWPEDIPVEYDYSSAKDASELLGTAGEGDTLTTAEACRENFIAGICEVSGLPSDAGLDNLPQTPPPKPGKATWISWCDKIGEWVPWLDPPTLAYLGMNPPCEDLEDGMFVYTTPLQGSELQCISPDRGDSGDISLAWGNCFGRCGKGCGSSFMKQFTLDCAYYDYCDRFGRGAVSGSCDGLFLAAVDDVMWAPSCDYTPPPTPPGDEVCDGPTEAPVPTPKPTPRPVPPPTPKPTPQPSPALSGKVRGTIYLDENGDGSPNPGEPGIPNVDVVITDSKGDKYTVTTDADGEYEQVVPPGATAIKIDRQTLPQCDDGKPPRQTDGTDPTTVTVPADGEATDLDGFEPCPTPEPTKSPTTPAALAGRVEGVVYEDTNGNGTQDGDEPGIPGVDVVITDSDGQTYTVVTNRNGEYGQDVPPGETTTDIDQDTLPVCDDGATRAQTEGDDPTTVTVPPNGVATDVDGYEPCPTPEPTKSPVTPKEPTASPVTPTPKPTPKPAPPPVGRVEGVVYEDTNGNGTQDDDEPGIRGVDVVITDSDGQTYVAVTNRNGEYGKDVPPGETTTDIDQDTLPVCDDGATRAQTEGDDPTTVTVPSGGVATDVDGYEPCPGVIEGVVYEDTNGDGNRDDGEPGIPDVVVVITDSRGDTYTVTTDENGEYEQPVPPGEATTEVDVDTIPVCVDGNPPTQTDGENPTTVVVPSNGSASDRDGYQCPTPEPTESPVTPKAPTKAPVPPTPKPTPPPPGRIEGVVYEDTNGNETQDDDEPGIEGVTVVITDSENTEYTVTTDPNGEYGQDVPPGEATTKIIRRTLPACDGEPYAQTEGTDPTTVTVPSGGVATDVDGFVPCPGVILGIVYEDTNSNGERDDGEPGIPDVVVVITDSQGNTYTVTTDDNGEYEQEVPPGEATTDIDVDTLPECVDGNPPNQSDGENPTTVVVPVGGIAEDVDGYEPCPTPEPTESPVTPTEPTKAPVPPTPKPAPPPPGRVEGVVYEDTNGNETQDDDEPGIEGVTVVITDTDGQTYTVVTDPNGEYGQDVPPGEVTTDIDEDTLPVCDDGATRDRTEGTNPTTLIVPPNGVARDVDGYEPCPTPEPTKSPTTAEVPPGRVEGVVYEDTNGNETQDDDEPGIEGVRVVITDSDGQTYTVVTDPNGDYGQDVPPGETTTDIDVDTIPVCDGAPYVQTEGNDPTTVTVPSEGVATDVDGFKPCPGVIEGVVYEDTNSNGIQDGNEPGIPDVVVVITDSQGNTYTVTTDDNGEYEQEVPPGEATTDIDEDTLPECVDGNPPNQTQGENPTTVVVPVGGVARDVDGYEPCPTPEPTKSPVTPKAPTKAPVPPTPAPTPPLFGRVEGIVYLDENEDGQQNIGEPGIPNVVVVITDSSGNQFIRTTDDNGEYGQDVVPGETTIDIDERTLPDCGARKLEQIEGTDPTDVIVPPNGVATDVDGFRPCPEPTLSPTAGPTEAPVTPKAPTKAPAPPTPKPTPPLTQLVKGIVYADLNGNGALDGDEEGISNVDVIITDSEGARMTVKTDFQGRYEEPVPAGETRIDVVEGSLPPTLAPWKQTEGDDPTFVTVPPGGEAEDIDGYAPGALVRGVVYLDENDNETQDPGEPGIRGVRVLITDSDGVVYTVTTVGGGNYDQRVPFGETTINVDENTLPVCADGNPLEQTEGTDPTTVTVPPGGVATDVDGYRPCPAEPTLAPIVKAAPVVPTQPPRPPPTQAPVPFQCIPADCLIETAPLPPCRPCACKGPMSSVTVRSSVVPTGGGKDPITVEALGNDEYRLSGISSSNLEVQPGDVKIHTSCSQEILGRTFGPYTVTQFVDKNGATCPAITEGCDPSLLPIGGSKSKSKGGAFVGVPGVPGVVGTIGKSKSKGGICDCQAKPMSAVYVETANNAPPTASNKCGPREVNPREGGGFEIITGGKGCGNELNVNGLEVHTSCSQEILGISNGQVTVTGFRDSGLVDCPPTPPPSRNKVWICHVVDHAGGMGARRESLCIPEDELVSGGHFLEGQYPFQRGPFGDYCGCCIGVPYINATTGQQACCDGDLIYGQCVPRPQSNIVEIAVGDPNFSTLVDLLGRAGLVGTLTGPGPFTVFAPTNTAFALFESESGTSLDDLSVEGLTTVLLYHVIGGQRILSPALTQGASVATVQGENVEVTSVTPPTVNNALINPADVVASNGVIHVINRVLVPPSLAES